MLLLLLLLIPILGIFVISTAISKNLSALKVKLIKLTALTTSILNLFLSLIIFILFDFTSNQFQFVQEYHQISSFDFYLGVDGLSIYFVLLTTIIIPISLLSNWISITENIRAYVIIILLLETLLLAVFLVLDILLFYIFFESILPPLFILIGLFGSSNRVRASFYLFLYTLLGSLFLLLSLLTMSSIMGTTDFDALYKTNFNYYTQLFLFYGIFIAFAVKTPTIFLNTWLLKAHVESPLGGSIILAGIVLKLSLYGILRLILPLLPKASLDYTYIVYLIGVITIIYASLSTLRTIDVKELIAYSSVSHAAVYLIGVFSNTIQGIEGGITLGLAHGFVSSGLFICAGGVLYDRSHTRLITYYRGLAQLMPLFSILFFILSLGNCGVPLTLNFVGEFLSLYGVFERLPLLGVFSSSSIIFSAAYTIYMFNRIAFAGSYSKFFNVNIIDLNKREFYILLILVVFTVVLGIYPAPILDGLHYSVSSLIYILPIWKLKLSKPRYPKILNLNNIAKPHVFCKLPLQNSLWFSIFTPQIFIMRKAISDFKTRLSFSYLYLLIKKSIIFRLILLVPFILLIKGGVNLDTARYCVLALALGYYVYMLRNVKFNIFSWLYVLTLLSLAFSTVIILGFLLSWLLSLALPILLPVLFSKLLLFLAVIDTSFLEGYNLSMNPHGDGHPGIEGSGASGGAGGSDGGSNGPGGSGGDTGSVGVAASSDEDSSSDSDDTSSNNDSELDREEHVPLPSNGVLRATYSSQDLPFLINGIDTAHHNNNTSQLLSLYSEAQEQVDYLNSVNPSRSDPAFNDLASNAQVVEDRCAEHIEDLTGVSDRNFDNLFNTCSEMILNGSTPAEVNEALNRNNDND